MLAKQGWSGGGLSSMRPPPRPSPFQGEGVRKHCENTMRRRFVTLDVFTDKRFTGNPLAVVLESDGLDKSDMQTIAREFNLAETVFVVPPADTNHRAMLRIFTPETELPFAGHPTVGTAVLLGCMSGYNLGVHDLVLEETVGLV